MWKKLAWALWVVVVAASAYIGFILLMFGLAAPDAAIPKKIVWIRTGSIVGGEALPFLLSVVLMLRRHFVLGPLAAAAMLPVAFVAMLVTGA